MFQGKPREKEWLTWAMVLAWSVLVVKIAPLARPLILELTRTVDRSILIYVTIGVTVLAAGIAVRYLLGKEHLRSWRRVAGLVLVVGVYVYLCLFHLTSPQDSLHFLEFGFLSLLAFRAFSHRLHDSGAYVAAILLSGLVGNVDEFFQWLTPRRIWDLRDLKWNIISAALAQLAVYEGMRPPYLALGFSRRSLRTIVRLLAVQVFFLGICLSNTPGRGAWLAIHFPSLRFLASHENVMTEYGHKYVDPEIGTYFSRLTMEELQASDQERGAIVGAILYQYPRLSGGAPMADLLRDYTSYWDPFMHELLVRVARRNHYRDVTPSHRGKPESYAWHCTVVYAENRILEKCFSNSITRGKALLAPSDLEMVKSGMGAMRPYKSPVSDHLITAFSEDQMRVVVCALLAFLAFLDFRLRDRR